MFDLFREKHILHITSKPINTPFVVDVLLTVIYFPQIGLDFALPDVDNPVLKTFINRVSGTDWSQVLAPDKSQAMVNYTISTPSFDAIQLTAVGSQTESTIALSPSEEVPLSIDLVSEVSSL